MQTIINKLKERFNLTVIVQTILAIITPVGVYYGITVGDLTTWAKLGDVICQAISNPAVIIAILISLWQTFNNPTESKIPFIKQEFKYKEEDE